MPDSGSAFSGSARERKLTEDELIRAIRFMVASEHKTIELYMQLAASTDNRLAVEVLTDIADQENRHAGEFQRLLHELAPAEEEFYAGGQSKQKPR